MPAKVILFIILSFSLNSALASEAVGKVNYVRGVLSGQVGDDNVRILSVDDELYLGELLSSGHSGFSVIELKDGSKISLRPNTELKLDQLNFKPKEANALLQLFRGGLRIVTGFISKNRNKPQAFKVRTIVATIGVRGTKFDARICEDDCEQNSGQSILVPVKKKQVIGRVAQLKGKIQAIEQLGRTRLLKQGSAIYEHDQLVTQLNSFSVIAFNDNSRITLSADSVVNLEKHQYNPNKADENNAFIRLLRGGLRLLSGQIGKLNRTQYTISALTATFGIRGTGFDLFCDGDCKALEKTTQQSSQSCQFRDSHSRIDMFRPKTDQAKKGILMRVWDGTIEVNYEDCQLLLEEGSVAVLENASIPPYRLFNTNTYKPEIDNIPRPDSIEIPDNFFQKSQPKRTKSEPKRAIKPDKAPNGLYVNVRDGDVQLLGNDGNQLDLGINEAGLVSLDGDITRLPATPEFIEFDQVPAPSIFNDEKAALINLLGTEQAADNKFICSIR